MRVIVLATSSVKCDFDDLDMCGYRDLSKAGSNWVQSRNSEPLTRMYSYLRTTHVRPGLFYERSVEAGLTSGCINTLPALRNKNSSLSSFSIFIAEGRRPQNDAPVLSSSSYLLWSCIPPDSCQSSL